MTTAIQNCCLTNKAPFKKNYEYIVTVKVLQITFENQLVLPVTRLAALTLSVLKTSVRYFTSTDLTLGQ